MKRIFMYISGFVALLVTSVSVVGAIIYSATHGADTLLTLATSTLQGIGVAIGGLVGSALVMRFKAARTFIGHTIDGIQDNRKK